MRSQKGIIRSREVLGEDADKIIAAFRDISPDFAQYITNFIFGDLYEREGLKDKERELAVVSNLIGQGKIGFPLKVHLKAMLQVGWTEHEIMELMILLIGYVGFPSIVEAIQTTQTVFNEKKK